MRLCLACRASFESGEWLCPCCGWRPRIENGRPLFAPELASGDGADAEYLYEELATAEERHFWFRARRRLILRAMRRHFPRAERILEIGCGTGYILAGIREKVRRASLAGSDVRADGLGYAAARVPETQLFQMDARRIPFRAEFDVIGAFDILEHVTEDETVLAEMRAALRRGGGVILTVPQHPWLWSEVDDFSHHKRRYTRQELLAKVRRSGLEPLRLTSFCALLLPLLAAARLRRRPPHEPFDPAKELRIGAATNAIGAMASRIEDSLDALGVRFPAGGSLLLVAAVRDSA